MRSFVRVMLTFLPAVGMSFVWTRYVWLSNSPWIVCADVLVACDRFPNIIYAFEIPDETIVDESREAARVRLDPYASIKPMFPDTRPIVLKPPQRDQRQ